uniref:CRIB domain-containing protein RIC4-like n=1 Tax=Erigeron canadensis TaxID=72917 RepID=UPI001CB9BEFA|nr:CRIB domain-containing protein RIC4-like [Erigeron canadensis]
MKDRMERLVVLPFTVGCVSSSSVSVSIQHYGRRPKEDINSARTVRRSMEIVKDPKGMSSDQMTNKELSKSSLLSRPNIYTIGSIHRLTKTIKNLSQSLVYKEEIEELEMEMEIGLPTDVKHVTHIGIDGSPTIGAKGINHLVASELLSLCPDAMASYEPCATVVPKDAK